MMQCPGCGGRNPESASVCDWCARPLRNNVSQGPRARVTLPILIGLALIALAVGAVLLISTTSRSTSNVPTSASAVTSPIPSASPKPSVPASQPTVTPQPTSEPVVLRARVVNTGGVGALVRVEPSVNAPNVGLVREDGIVTLLGPEETVQAQVWRQVQDDQGNQGWIRADYLSQIEQTTPLPLAPPP
jgi:hypothetical protein